MSKALGEKMTPRVQKLGRGEVSQQADVALKKHEGKNMTWPTKYVAGCWDYFEDKGKVAWPPGEEELKIKCFCKQNSSPEICETLVFSPLRGFVKKQEAGRSTDCCCPTFPLLGLNVKQVKSNLFILKDASANTNLIFKWISIGLCLFLLYAVITENKVAFALSVLANI